MSFKSREKKRRRKIGIETARGQHREKIAGRHYLTIVSRAACCNDCGGSLRPGRECVYRFKPREILCTTCAASRKIRYRLSRRWEVQPATRLLGHTPGAPTNTAGHRATGPGPEPRR
ncbi:MAG: hypothetical protein ACRDMH_00410 [Solirubrobacterales bacterium]